MEEDYIEGEEYERLVKLFDELRELRAIVRALPKYAAITNGSGLWERIAKAIKRMPEEEE